MLDSKLSTSSVSPELWQAIAPVHLICLSTDISACTQKIYKWVQVSLRTGCKRMLRLIFLPIFCNHEQPKLLASLSFRRFCLSFGEFCLSFRNLTWVIKQKPRNVEIIVSRLTVERVFFQTSVVCLCCCFSGWNGQDTLLWQAWIF